MNFTFYYPWSLKEKFIDNILNKASISVDFLNNDEMAIFYLHHDSFENFQLLLNQCHRSINLNFLLRVACLYGNLDSVKILLSLGANAKSNEQIAFREAVFHNHLDIVEYFVEYEKNYDYPFDYDWAFEISAENGYLESVRFFLDQGVDINVDDGFALISALHKNHYSVVEYLLSEDCIIGTYSTLITKILAKQQFSLIELLLKYQFDLKSYTDVLDEKSVFFVILMEHENSSTAITTLNFLIKHGIFYNYDSCLLTCAKENNFILFQYFFDLGGDILKSNVLNIQDSLIISEDFKNFAQKLYQSSQLHAQLEFDLDHTKQNTSQVKI